MPEGTFSLRAVTGTGNRMNVEILEVFALKGHGFGF
jgi:hypothetical protein